jgi:uridine phosphorylase
MAVYPESELILNKDGSIYHLRLLPEHLSDTIITVGDPGRVHRVSQHFDDIDFEMNTREFITHVGRYKGKRITVISSGMGTENIEILLTELDALANIDLKKREPKKQHRRLKIIRIGTSGALQKEVEVGTHLVSDYAVGLDNLMYFYNLEQGEYEKFISDKLTKDAGLSFHPYVVRCAENLKRQIGFDMVEGNTVTCPGFYAPQGRKLRLDLRIPNLVDDLNSFHHDGFWLTNFEMETSGYYAFGKLLGHDVLSVNAIIANRISHQFAKNSHAIVDSLILKVLDRI